MLGARWRTRLKNQSGQMAGTLLLTLAASLLACGAAYTPGRPAWSPLRPGAAPATRRIVLRDSGLRKWSAAAGRCRMPE